MPDEPTSAIIKIIVTIVAALLASAIIGLVKKRRLFLVVPKLFSFSQLSDKGKIIELTIINRGFKTEEKIEIQLNPTCTYELVASTDGSTVLHKNKISVERLSGEDEITAIVLTEGKEFTREDIISVSSKETKGKLVKKTRRHTTVFEIDINIHNNLWTVFFVYIFIAHNSRICEKRYIGRRERIKGAKKLP